MKSRFSDVEKAWAVESGSYAMYLRHRYCYLREDLSNPDYGSAFNLPDYLVCQSIWSSQHQRANRLRKRIKDMMEHGAWFLTLTFRDSVLASTSKESRRVFVRRFLKANFGKFVANKDFGADFGREHYHCVVALPDDAAVFSLVHDSKGAHASLNGWDYGFSNWEKIGSSDADKDLKRVSKYIAKLSNHALKETSCKERMIFSRSLHET